MDWKATLDSELGKLHALNLYERFRAILPVFSKIGFFNHLKEFNDNSIQLYADILKYLGGHEHVSAYGLGLACMVQANLSGSILKIATKNKELENLIGGRLISSFAVSEKGWKGRLSNTKTKLSGVGEINSTNSSLDVPEKDLSQFHYLLSGEKSFATNGRQADLYLVVARLESKDAAIEKNPHSPEYKIILLPRNTAGLEIEPFDLDESKEATHAIIRFKNIKIMADDILDLNYKEHARYLPYWERFCFHFLLIGLVRRILTENKHPELQELKHGLTSELDDLEEKINYKLKMVASSGIHILKLKDSIIGQDLINRLLQMQGISTIYPELKLFERLI